MIIVKYIVFLVSSLISAASVADDYNGDAVNYIFSKDDLRNQTVITRRHDLNSDGIDEIILTIQGSHFCGMYREFGCSYFVLQKQDKWKVIFAETNVQFLDVSTDKTYGYYDLLVSFYDYDSKPDNIEYNVTTYPWRLGKTYSDDSDMWNK